MVDVVDGPGVAFPLSIDVGSGEGTGMVMLEVFEINQGHMTSLTVLQNCWLSGRPTAASGLPGTPLRLRFKPQDRYTRLVGMIPYIL